MNSLTLSNPLPLDQNPAAVYVASLGGPKSTGGQTQWQSLHVIARLLGSDPYNLNWGALRYQHTAMIRARLAETYSPATVNKMLSALRQTLKHARRLGQIAGEDYENAIDLDPITGETLPAGRELSTGELIALIATCKAEGTNAGTRDAALIALMYAAGLRRAEVVSLTLSDYNPQTGELKVTGKRNKERMAYITNGAQSALSDWLAIRGDTGEALFVEVNKGDNLVTLKHISPEAIYNMFAKRAAQAGIRSLSPHDMRRTFVSHLLDAGADISTVSKMAGHANIKTTARYDRRPEEAKRKAAQLLHVPY